MTLQSTTCSTASGQDATMADSACAQVGSFNQLDLWFCGAQLARVAEQDSVQTRQGPCLGRARQGVLALRFRRVP